MKRYRIRTSETDSVKGLPSTQNVDVNLRQTAKTLPFPNVSSIISQREVYEEERQACTKFRLIVTVIPYCSNVLFNALTEIVKDEGSDTPIVITDKTNTEDSEDKVTIGNAMGKDTPTRVHMVSDTEYSSDLHGGYEYHPGYDFFDNHILRNQSFKVVNPIGVSNSKVKEPENAFNTLWDYLRDRNGAYKQFARRLSINSLSSQSLDKGVYKHLYLIGDVLSIDESINQNLYDDNGWWGFANNTTIDPKELANRKWESIDIGRALNNRKSCEFIDMYPDRTLFSFAPKFNEFTHKNENNWNITVTYPYRNIYDHPLCLGGSSYIRRSTDSDGNNVEDTISEGNRWMGLKILTAQIGSGKIGSNVLMFRTYTKHGLTKGDTFYLYFTDPYNPNEGDGTYAGCPKFGDETLDGREIYYESDSYYKVTNVGDLSKKNSDYFFYTTDTSLLTDLYESYLLYVQKKLSEMGDEEEPSNDTIAFYDLYEEDDKKSIYDEEGDLKTTLLNNILKYTNFRLRRCVNGVKSTYYIRQFRQIPNLRAARRAMTDEEQLHKSKFNGVFEKYVEENATDPLNPSYQRTFNNEMYQLGFAANIYNDNVAQITFTDGFDTKGLTDNLGRPLSEIYYTIVKNNAGHEAWYNPENPVYSTKDAQPIYGEDYTVEFSHCFGRITSGFETHVQDDDLESTTAPNSYWKRLSSVHHISNIINNNGTITEDDVSRPLDTDIKYRDKFFYGDLAEFNAMEFEEKTLSHVMHRFNTAQRETINNPYYSEFQFHEITADDYDRGDSISLSDSAFTVGEYSAVNGVTGVLPETTYTTKGFAVTDESIYDFSTISRPEGYYYQAHHPIKIRQYTSIKQGSNTTLRIRYAQPVQRGSILIQVKTYSAHKLSVNDIIFVCDDESDTRYITRCMGVVDRTTFLMSPDYSEYVTNATDFEDVEYISNIRKDAGDDGNSRNYDERYSWLQLCDILNGKYEDNLDYPILTLRRKNPDIPDYATYIGDNRYIWRDLVNIGDSRATELDDFIFANGYFYVTQRLNFYLKRQDPFGNNGLYFDGELKYPFFPNDPTGVEQEESNYETTDTEDLPC